MPRKPEIFGLSASYLHLICRPIKRKNGTMKKSLALIAVAVALTGCANTGAKYIPVVDRRSETYTQDLADCQELAKSRDSAGAGAAKGAVVGALLGAFIMQAVVGSGGQYGAATGAVSGATTAGVAAELAQRNIITSCLQGRGHQVLN